MNKLDDFDKLLKKKAQEDVCYIPEKLNKNINNILANLPENKKYKRPIIKIALVAALVAAISGTTVMASTNPAVKNMVNGILSYFNNKSDTRYITDKTSFDKFNKSVGISAEDKGIKLTVDNIATDDNFINIFYTIESQSSIDMFPNDDEAKIFDAVLSTPFLQLKINGKEAEPANHSDVDAYFESDKVLKVMRRFNVSQIDLPEEFDLEISTDEIFRTKGEWEIKASVDKSDIAVETKTVKPNINKIINLGDYKHNITIDKVSISPFGNQIVISEKTSDDNIFDTFAIFDDNDTNLDVLNIDMSGNSFGKATNSFEFIKGTINMKYISLVPIKFTESGNSIIEKVDIQKLPITFKTSNTGSRVVDKIEFDKNVIRIKYHNEGIQFYDPAFLFYDVDGNELDLGTCGGATAVDRQTGQFTETLTFANKNVDFSKITQIGTFTGVDHMELFKDQAIKINLQ
ncbi:hypothetical protein psyc5s11_32960 [Clostridium gelidum]|uniref:DUF4179 domain-containing protein n=1 Tax=Clostridium gelidum TaxID=704125 RepID=A0ABM7T5H8_9CLOT|nr:DUF4179 domain-containing protein [Clostridium gelidum]BCZ47229.1 hypothetical protein psyc5s11_32960 [Clostridium gelidum]